MLLVGALYARLVLDALLGAGASSITSSDLHKTLTLTPFSAIAVSAQGCSSDLNETLALIPLSTIKASAQGCFRFVLVHPKPLSWESIVRNRYKLKLFEIVL